jgi:hypothetical protein
VPLIFCRAPLTATFRRAVQANWTPVQFFWNPFGGYGRKSARINPPPAHHARYLRELARVGCYGKGKAGVMRRFIENGIAQALEAGVIAPKNIEDFGERIEDDEAPDED